MGGQAWAGLGEGPAEALAGAFTAAVRRRSRTVGTVDLLAQIALRGRQVRSVPLHRRRETLIRIAAGQATPSQDQPGELRDSGPGPDSAEVRAALREARWRAGRLAAGRFTPISPADVREWGDQPQWTPAVPEVLAGAVAAAREHGRAFAGLTDLLLGTLRAGDCAGARYLHPDDRDRVAAIAGLERGDRSRPAAPLPGLGEVVAAGGTGSRGPAGRVIGRFLAGMSRLGRLDPLLVAAHGDLKRQAARLGHGVVGPAHAVLALLAVETAAASLATTATRHSQGGPLLLAAGADLGRLHLVVEARQAAPVPSAAMLAAQAPEMRTGDPFLGDEVVAAERRAAALSLDHRHARAGTTHYLVALLEDDRGDAAVVLRDLGVDVAVLRAAARDSMALAPAAWG